MIQTISIKKARKLLGKDANNITDEELEKDIEAATLLKDLFFSSYINSKKNT